MSDLSRYLKTEFRQPDFVRTQLAGRRLSWWQRLRQWWIGPAVPPRCGRHQWPHRRTLSWQVGDSPLRLTVLTGSLWLTKRGDGQDYIVEPSHVFVWTPGHWVVQALAPVHFRLDLIPSPKEVCHGKATLLPVLQRL